VSVKGGLEQWSKAYSSDGKSTDPLGDESYEADRVKGGGDHGRAINQREPGLGHTLTRLAKEPRGYKL